MPHEFDYALYKKQRELGGEIIGKIQAATRTYGTPFVMHGISLSCSLDNNRVVLEFGPTSPAGSKELLAHLKTYLSSHGFDGELMYQSRLTIPNAISDSFADHFKKGLDAYKRNQGRGDRSARKS